MVERIICILIGYICGLLQTSYLYGKAKGIDIRNYGSGNAGTTNALRTLGAKAGAITFLGDCFKCVVAVMIVRLVFGGSHPEIIRLLGLYASAGAILGHNFPFYLKFRGGKGIACTTGVIIAFHWQMAPLCILVFIATVLITKYVSFGSILLVSVFLVELIVFGQTGHLPIANSYLPEIYILGAIFTGMAIWRHRANIKRLLSGTENKFIIKEMLKKK